MEIFIIQSKDVDSKDLYLQRINQQKIEQVEALEKVLQPDDFWDYIGIIDMLEKHHGYLMLAYDESILIGYIIYGFVFECAEIWRIGTNKLYQRKGVATYLLHALYRELHILQVAHIMLEVKRTNLAAQSLYQQHGFTEINCRKDYYKNKDGTRVDALILQKIL